ncbi:GGDEF domain-containing protein [Domibacillus indicus]|uniref:GGDEF domain-containing protein n=1 Tax=Domibacillus indicus TaxID=1437523 RepID=UPI000617F0F1|nr:GGDEF domain-containing protein [Domibacillus indicus]
MESHNISRMNYKQWSEKIIHFYWLMVLVSLIGQCTGLAVKLYYFPEEAKEFALEKVLLPTGIQLIVMLGCLLIVKAKKIYSSRVLTVTGTLVALVIIIRHPNVTGLQTVLLLPMAVALIYFDKKKLLFSFYVNFVALTGIYLIPAVRRAVTEYEYFSYMLILVAGYFIYSAVIQRGSEVLQILQKASEKEKELLVKSTMMERLSKVDALTGLYNHKTFHEYMDYLVEQSRQYGMPLQLAILDIDNFKNINDTYGHNIGDLVLKRLAHAIVEKASENDIVARYGGEEFALLLTNKKVTDAYDVIEAIREHIAGIQHEEMNGLNVTVSIGLKDFDQSLTRLDFFQQADALLYKAKRSGKNQVACDSLLAQH